MARARRYSHVTKMLFIAAVSGLDAPRGLARRGVLAQSLLFVPGVANAGIADQLEAASRASEITYSQNGKNFARMAAGDDGLQIWQSPGAGKICRREGVHGRRARRAR